MLPAPRTAVPLLAAPPLRACVLVTCAFALAARAASAQDGVSLELRVERAIERGVHHVVQDQRPDGTWPGEEEPHPGGMSSLACLTLLKSGLGRDEAPLRDGLAALRKVTFKSIYSAAVYLMLQEALIDKSKTHVDDAGRACFDLIVANQREGLWAYPTGNVDMSNTQFALLGLRAGAHLGFEVPEKTVETCTTALFRWQKEAGGFPYEPGREPTASMSAASLGGLAVLAELGKGKERVESALRKHRSEIERAELWLEQHFSAERNAYGERFWTSTFHYAHLWAIERWCGFTQRPKIGAHDWYREIAAWLVAEQHPDGAWGRSLPDTCFALLFLRRATLSAPFELRDTWKKLDQEKAAQGATPKLAPAAGVACVTEWLACGPLRDKPGMPQLLDPSALHLDKLRAKERTPLAGSEFEPVSLKKEGWTNLDELTKRDADGCEWVLATTLVWEPPKVGENDKGKEPAALAAILWLTFEDGCKVWFDGKLVSESLRMQSPIEEDTRIDLALAPGVHTLVALLGDERGAAAFGARLTDARGQALPAGFSISAEPPIKGGKRK